jgi:hypothetical protein
MTLTSGTTVGQLTITNTKDVNNFVYPSLYSLANLSFTSVLTYYKRFLTDVNSSIINSTMSWTSTDGLMTFAGFTNVATYTPLDYNGYKAIKIGSGSPNIQPILTPEKTCVYIYDGRMQKQAGVDSVIFYMGFVDGSTTGDRSYFYNTSGDGTTMNYGQTVNSTQTFGSNALTITGMDIAKWTSLIVTTSVTENIIYVNGVLRFKFARTIRDATTKMHPLDIASFPGQNRTPNLKVLELGFINRYCDATDCQTIHSNALARYGAQ